MTRPTGNKSLIEVTGILESLVDKVDKLDSKLESLKDEKISSMEKEIVVLKQQIVHINEKQNTTRNLVFTIIGSLITFALIGIITFLLRKIGA